MQGGNTMDFYTAVLRKSGPYWVALCLENGIVGQGYTKKAAIAKLKEAIDSIVEAQRTDSAVYFVPLLIKELRLFRLSIMPVDNLLI